MKSVKFSFFRILDQTVMDGLFIEFEPYNLEYLGESKIKEIKKSRKSDRFHIEIPSEDCDWTPDYHNIIIHRKCTIKKPHSLFTDDKGVAYGDEELGVAAIISSIVSSRRIVVAYDGSITDSDQPVTLELNTVLPSKTYRGSFTIETVLYVKNKSSDNPPAYICNTAGTKLGQLEQNTEVYIDEKTPEFPTRIHGEGSKNPLWRISITWKNPLIDEFMKNVCLLINEDNPEFKSLKLDSDNRNKGMLTEIYSSAILEIIYSIKNDGNPHVWEDTLSGNPDSIREGSVSDYIYYMLSQRFDSDASDIVSLSHKIRKTIYGGL